MDVFLLTSFLSKLKNNDEIEVCASAAAGRLSVGSSAGPGSNPVEANFVKRKCPTRPSYADEPVSQMARHLCGNLAILI